MEKILKKHLKDGKFDGVSINRSKVMSSIRGKGNRSTEVRLRMAFVREGITGWKLHPKNIPGTPDFYFPNDRLAIFVDGCFWHGCPKCGHIPKTRSKFWQAKIQRTKKRDRAKRSELRKFGITVFSIWEHDLKEMSGINRILKKTKKLLQASGVK